MRRAACMLSAGSSRLWYRLKEFRSNIEAYNWVKEQKGSLVTKR